MTAAQDQIAGQNSWSLCEQADGSLTLLHANGTELKGLGCAYKLTALTAAEAPPLNLQRLAGEKRTDAERTIPIDSRYFSTFETPDKFRCRLRIVAGVDSDWIELTAEVTNLSSEPVYLDAFLPVIFAGVGASAKLDRVLMNGYDMLGPTGLYESEPGNKHESHHVVGFTDGEGTNAVVLGFADPAHWFAPIGIECHGTAGSAAAVHYSLGAALRLDGTPWLAGETRTLPRFLAGAGESLSALMAAYARRTAIQGNSRPLRTDAIPPATGWCSWYDYYGTETAEDVLRDAQSLAASDLSAQLQYVQIDDGWNLPEPGAPRVWGDWAEAGAKFPDGMKAVAQQIRDLGFRPGLWLAPFSVDPASRVFKEHPEWLIRNEHDNPSDYWGVYGLDLSQPAVQEFLRQTITRVFQDWNFEYIKIDFLLHGAMQGRRNDATFTAAQALRKGLEVIRESADAASERDGRRRYVLTCGCPLGPAIGLADAMRIGPDVSRRWYLPMNVPEWPEGNCSIRPGAVYSIWRQWMHGSWWSNDPDCLVTGNSATYAERNVLAKEIEGGRFAESPPFGLSDEEAALWARLVWALGGLVVLSETPSRLSEDRLNLIRTALAVRPSGSTWVDWYADPRVPLLKLVSETESSPGFAIFNLRDEAVEGIEIPVSKLGLKNHCSAISFRELISGETLQFTLSGPETLINLPALPGRAARVWIHVPQL